MRSRRSFAATLAFAVAARASARRNGTLGLAMFALPLAVIGAIGLALGGYTDPHFSLGVLDEARSAASRSLLERLAADPMVRLRAYSSEDPMRRAVFRGRLHGGLVIPAGWRGERGVAVIATAASPGTAVLRAILDAELARPLARKPGAAADVRIEVVGGGPLSPPPIGVQYTAPANLVLFVLINGLLHAAGILELRRRGIARRLLATPAGRGELFLGLAVGPFQVMAAQAAFLIVSTSLVFGVAWGDWSGVLLMTGSLLLLGTATVLFVGTLLRMPQQAYVFAPWIGIVLGMLGGCMWPLEVVPAPMRQLGHLFPTAWAMDGFLDLSFGGAGPAGVLREAAVVTAMAAFLAAIGLWRLRRQLAS